MYVCANLFDIVNTSQHPDASVVEDGEFFCQFLLAGLHHSPRHLLSLVISNPDPEKKGKYPQPLVPKMIEK